MGGSIFLQKKKKISLLLISSRSFIFSLPIFSSSSRLHQTLASSALHLLASSSSHLISLLSLFLFLMQRSKVKGNWIPTEIYWRKCHVKNKDIWKFLNGIYIKKRSWSLEVINTSMESTNSKTTKYW
uniref:Uncharacterized protein n=1 Tax=Cucumis melo TaxID=3656 RepID=A0A9I9EH01_CUCME